MIFFFEALEFMAALNELNNKIYPLKLGSKALIIMNILIIN